jgi:hypothetical protein
VDVVARLLADLLELVLHMYPPVLRTKPTSITSASGRPNSSSSATAIFMPSSCPFFTTTPSLSAAMAGEPAAAYCLINLECAYYSELCVVWRAWGWVV